ncbi:hypothetical protein OHA40_11075 [Nocardia sp. NBC_00508]|uniref:DUF7373 family lipoprotein n=1 Tax=Nocardia sp. NBC_00508 TaxID=2975992 RepID=UPI002E815508|nr:hypothetical protein [Nocardia sp. NBC_00508]WUD68599.1 hypothetical protein OHA40_11075 [Nocardia sp. NBC_00508]
MSRPVRTAGALIMAAIVAAGAGACGNSDTGTEQSARPVDLAQLDVGSYATQPRELGPVKNPEQARMVEAERLANFVPAPSDIDPAFVHANPSIAKIFIEPKAALGRIMDVSRFAEAAPDFVAGFLSSAGSAPDNRGTDLVNAVLIFPDEQKASAAAAALERVDFEANERNTRVQLPKYPAAHAHWQPQEQSIGSWFATGRFVVYTWIYDYVKIFLEKVDFAELHTLVEKSLDRVVPSIGRFTPTPVDQLMTLPIDMDGMLNRALPRPREDSWIDPPGAYTGHGALHFTTDSAEDRRQIEAAGVDRFATDGTDLYRARDAAAAARLREDRGGLTKKFRGAESPKGLPVARCKEYIGNKTVVVRFYCSVTYDRYAAFAWSHQLLDAQQRISAQYALLVNAA